MFVSRYGSEPLPHLTRALSFSNLQGEAKKRQWNIINILETSLQELITEGKNKLFACLQGTGDQLRKLRPSWVLGLLHHLYRPHPDLPSKGVQDLQLLARDLWQRPVLRNKMFPNVFCSGHSHFLQRRVDWIGQHLDRCTSCKPRGLSPRVNYADRATASCRRS
jgi:hypothetical protein